MVSGGYINGAETLLQMNYLPSSAIIRNHDQVVTSGSTVYPRGLIMGYVVDAGFEETGVAKFALLDPAAEISSLEQVFIITKYTTEDIATVTADQPSEESDILETTPDGNVG
jgi:rod shape-determining protein MreC